MRRLVGLIALLILISGAAWLLYREELSRQATQETEVFEPARSADESVPPDSPVEPPTTSVEAPPREREAPAPGSDVAAAPEPSEPLPGATETVDPGPGATSEAEESDTASEAEGHAPEAPASSSESAAAPERSEPAPPPTERETAAPAPTPTPTPEAAAPETTTEADNPARETETSRVEPQVSPEPEAEPSVGVVPTFDVVRVEPSGETVIAGLAAPETTVEVLDGVNPLAEAKANRRGEWALALDTPLPPGSHDLAIRTTSPDKAVVTLSDQRVAVSVPENGKEKPLVVLNGPEGPSRVIQVPEPEAPQGPEVAAAPEPEPAPAPAPETAIAPPETTDPPAAGEGPATAEAPATLEEEPSEPEIAAAPPQQDPAPEEPAPPPAASAEVPAQPPTAEGETQPSIEPKVGIAAVEADSDGTLYIAGTATTSDPVRVYIDGALVGEASPSESGTWLVEAKRELGPGRYTVRADQVEAASGDVIMRAEVPFEREIEVAVLRPTGDAVAPEGSAEVSGSVAGPMTVIIKRGDNLWSISREMYGRGIRYSTIYNANRDQIRDPDWIYPGQVFVLPEGDTAWETN